MVEQEKAGSPGGRLITDSHKEGASREWSGCMPDHTAVLCLFLLSFFYSRTLLLTLRPLQLSTSWSPTVLRRSSLPSRSFRAIWTLRQRNIYANEGPLQPLSSSITTPMHQTQLSPAQRKTSVYTPPTMRGKDQSSKQKSGQEESPHLPKHTHSQLDTLSEELTDRDAVDQPSTTGMMKKLEAGFSPVFQEEEEDKTFTEDKDTQEK
ncbi:protein phosphatase 1 regulatory subunit 1C isoform X1 [Tachysurus fulvidraco]|uniref:protein phosphatase 1 regulatory subunit 1C isoform X1 n=1 Tax=Tachysurus fulvidraco TaxID=1234273 RepID=UPI001FEF3996|nr:protein phosphatase 1 regulatory subunit 1C isoform X1 [Tachysurus fulvidraco]